MLQINYLELNLLFFNFIVIIFCWIIIIKNRFSLKQVNLNELEKRRNITTDFIIGIGSGLVVFVLGWFADNLTFSNIKLNSISELLFSIFTGMISLLFQISILLALISWIVRLSFKDLN